MKVLYISYDGMTDNLGQSQVIPYLKGLIKHGHTFDILSFEKPANYTEREKIVSSMLKDAGIGWYPMTYTKRPPILASVYDTIRMHRKAKQLYLSNNYDATHCRSYMPAMAGQMLKHKFGCRFIFDMRGFWPDERIDGNIWNIKNPVYKWIYNFFKKKELQFFNEADYSISLTRAGYKEICKWKISPQQLENFSIIPCCADFELFRVIPENKELKKQLNISDSNKVLCYLGSIGTWYMFDEMLQFFALLRKSDPTYCFLLVTPESEQFVLNSAARFQIPPEAIRVVFASRKMVPEYLSLAHAGISFIKPCFSKQSSSPTKMGEMMASGLPVICNDGVGDVDEYIKQSGAGILLKDFSENEMKRTVEKLSVLNISKEEVRNRAYQIFNLEHGVELYADVYRKLENMTTHKNPNAPR
ncbi:MAG: glycosyltransferase [Bacteroidetes bacterium]|jgi:glycosyltransferase involved in cell wall biosynthesis|nr:glycosyltransferase [Bacteroidota bacterium]